MRTPYHVLPDVHCGRVRAFLPTHLPSRGRSYVFLAQNRLIAEATALEHERTVLDRRLERMRERMAENAARAKKADAQ